VRLRREQGAVVLAVEDRGCGLSAAEAEHVFDPFYRSPQTRSRTGVGLGLAVARRIVAAFGGSIRVESEPGTGSRFELRLPEPVSRSAAIDVAPAAAPLRPLESSSRAGTPEI
jgi:signal transduction histidine kinase